MRRHRRWLVLMLLVVAGNAGRAEATHLRLAILESDFYTDAQAELFSTGKFSLTADFDVQAFTPTLAMMSSYDVILAYTNNPPFDGDALGDLLADFVDAGGHVVLANYSFFGGPYAIGGRIMAPGYSPLLYSGNFGPLGGAVVPNDPNDPVFTGITPALVTYSYTINGPLPNLAPGATQVATDGLGQNLIARNAAGNVIATTFYPADPTGAPGNNAFFYHLLSNLVDPDLVPVPEPATLGLAVAAMLGLAFRRRRGGSS